MNDVFQYDINESHNHTTGGCNSLVCKAGVSIDNIIPIFIRGSTEDPRRRGLDAGSGSGAGGDALSEIT